MKKKKKPLIEIFYDILRYIGIAIIIFVAAFLSFYPEYLKYKAVYDDEAPIWVIFFR